MKIRAIVIQASNDIPRAPKKIRLLTNRHSISFEDAEDDNAILQEIDLSEVDVREGKRIDLRFVRFQSVSSLHVGPLREEILSRNWMRADARCDCRSSSSLTRGGRTRHGSTR